MCGVPEVKLKELAIPFDIKALRWRVGSTNKARTSGLALPYIEARHVMHRLDEVCGPGNWVNEYKDSPLEGGILCGISIQIKYADGNSEWITKWDGAEAKGSAGVGVKGGISDSLKRAGVHWGIARYLYALPKYWVETVPVGVKSAKFKDGQIAVVLGKLPKWAKPGGGGQPEDPDPDDDIGDDLDQPGIDPVSEKIIAETVSGSNGSGPKNPDDWGPVGVFVSAHKDLTGSDIALLRKDSGDDAVKVWAVLQAEWGAPA